HEGILDLVSLAHIDGDDLHPQSRRGGLHGGELTDPSSYSRVPKNCGSGNAGCHLLEQFQKFSAHAVFEHQKPVALPPGRARLSTKPAPTGSGTIVNTIGIDRVACSNGPTVELPVA